MRGPPVPCAEGVRGQLWRLQRRGRLRLHRADFGELWAFNLNILYYYQVCGSCLTVSGSDIFITPSDPDPIFRYVVLKNLT